MNNCSRIKIEESLSSLIEVGMRVIKPVLYAADIVTFEAAILATGIVNRGEALIAICAAYLEGKHV